MLTGLWNLKDIQNSRQNRSKNKLVRENAVTRAHGSCSLRVMGSSYVTQQYLLSPESCRFFWSRQVWTRMATAMRGEAKNGYVRKHMEDCSLLKKIKATCVQQIFHKVTFGHYLLPQKIDVLADLPGSQ